MQHIHDNKPPLSHGTASLWVDLVFWHPNEKDARQLTTYLEQYGLGERSQTVEWLDKFTVRLAMWRGRYWYYVTPDEWRDASQDLIHFIKTTADHYQCRKVEYDTRAFTVGLSKKVRRQRQPLEKLADNQPAHDHPEWWMITP